uniref:Uncharacterized protein n=1 Tax=Romanomermis culicivorax TaxID=13658 RepID=A0A915IV32_ROMCU
MYPFAENTPPTKEQVQKWMDEGDVQELEKLVLEGRGHMVSERWSSNPETEDFLSVLPQYQMVRASQKTQNSKIDAIHKSVEEGDVRRVKSLVDRSEMALAKNKWATLFLGHESDLKFELGLEKSYWNFDAQNSQLKIFTTSNLNGKKKLILKTINLRPEFVAKRHEWDKLDLKSVAFAMNGENLASYSVESHWYDIWAENLEPTTLLSQEPIVPFFLFTLEVKDDVTINIKMADSNSKRTRKNFHKVNTNDKEIPEFKNILKMLASEDEIVATRGFDEMLRKLELFYRNNFYGGTVEEIKAFSSISQCGFTHGAFTSIQKKLNLKIAVDQIKVANPAFRIRISWNVKRSWKDVARKWPMQVDFIANLDQLEQNRQKVLGEAMAASAQMSAEMMANSFKSDVLLAHVNFRSREKSHRIAKIPVVSPLTATISLARRLGAITLDVPLREHLERLKLFLDGELSFLLQAFRPAVKSEKSKFASRYFHGCIASSDFLSEPNSAAYKIELKNPSKLEKQSMTSFLINTIDESVDLILNVYEMHKFQQRDFTEIMAYSGSRKYPKTSDRVKHTVIYDFYVSFTETDEKKFKSLLLPKSQCYMKSIAKDGGADFHMKKLEPLHLLQEFRNYDGKAPDQTKNDKKILMHIKEYFNENFLYLKSKYEMKALFHGLLHKVKTVPNIIDVRKDVLQIAFMDHNDQNMNLVNFAYGTNNDVIESLDDMREFVDSNLLKHSENVKAMNLAIVHHPDSDVEALVVRNDFLSVLGLCQRLSKNRAKRQNKCSELEGFLPNKEKNELYVKTGENDLILHESKTKVYMKNLGRISSGIMFGLMAKDFISDLIHGNVAGMALNAGFIITNILASHFADRLWSKIKLLTKEDKILLAGILKVGSPFLRRLPSFAFVGFDLYNSVQAYKNNQSEMLVNIVADTGYIALDVAETVIEVAEGFEVIEGVSAVTGPIGWATGAALLVGADIYQSVNKVQHINANIHLTKMERFTEGLRSFFGMDPEDHIKKLMEEKRELEDLVAEMRIFLKQSHAIKRYVSTMKSKELSSNTNQTVVLNYDCLDLERIKIEILDDKAIVSFHFPRNSIGVIEMGIRHPAPITFVDGSVLQLKNNHASLDVHTSLSVEDAVRIYSKFVAESGISCVIHSAVQNTTVTLNHHSLTGNTSDYVLDVAFSTSTHQSFRSMADEIVYVINSNKDNDQNNSSAIVTQNTEIQVDYEHKQKIVVDLDQIVSTYRMKNVDLRPYVSGCDVKINVSVSNQNPINQITFKNAIKNHGLDFGSEVHFARKLYDYDFFNMNETHLMMTNILHTVTKEDALEDHFTLILRDFFADEIMKSLKLVFSTDFDGSISLQATFHIVGLLDVQPQSILSQSIVPLLRLVLEFSLFFIHQKDVISIKHGQTDTLRWLATKYPETCNAEDYNGRTPLHYAAAYSSNNVFVKILQKFGGDAFLEDKYGHTPFYYRSNPERLSALQKVKSESVMEQLLAGGLMRSLLQELEEEIVDWLRAGNLGKLEELVLSGYGDLLLGKVAQVEDKEVLNFLEILPQYQAKIQAIHRSIEHGNLQKVKSLLDRKKLALARDRRGATPLHKSVLFNRNDATVWLLKNYPQAINALDHNKRTPLHYAAALSSTDCGQAYKLLLKYGANPNMEDG